ncbi:MAG: outer membrane protein domain-containing protein [Gallionellaceae bacterium]|nr:MAG: outer membrane protein domain-containing protein [Gallionellaceae bacterium]
MKKIVLAAALFALAPQAYADTTVNGKISTLGLGVEAAFPITQSVDARIGFNTYKYSFDKAVTSGGATANYNGDLKLQSLQALADWHPWEGSFRLSGGLVYNNNKFDMTATSGTFNNVGAPVAMAAGEYVNATVDFDKVAPYLGIGWGRTPKNTGLSFTSDIGVMFQGTPKGAVTTNIGAATAADIANANASLNDSLKNFKIYPVLSIGIGYTF